MANISVNDIQPTGAELFSDLEGFMDELNDGELNSLAGGGNCTAVATCQCTFAKGCNGIVAQQQLVAANSDLAQPKLFAAEYIPRILG
jgi:hypothetical protein